MTNNLLVIYNFHFTWSFDQAWNKIFPVLDETRFAADVRDTGRGDRGE